MSPVPLTLQIRNAETLRNLEQVAKALGVSTDDFAEAAIERELAVVGAGLEGKLVRALEKLKSYSSADLDRDLKELVRSEIEIEDPLRARLVEPSDAYGVGALFGHPVERG
jgi:hypothetical protein